jgi:serine/threonine protein kinase
MNDGKIKTIKTHEILKSKKELEDGYKPKKRQIIGEGTYGCVFKPSLQCAKKPSANFNYNDYVSKFMKTKNAEIELKEFVFIGKIDPTNDYHLGEPIMCEPDFDDPELINDIKHCRNINKNDFLNNEIKDNYSLLIIKYGGPDLKDLCMNHIIKYISTNKENKTDNFWLEVHHLIKGLKFFKDNGIVHNDIKPQNILFNLKTGKMKYIDFGLMRTKNEIITSSKKNKNNAGVFHWSYPFECAYMNKSRFKDYKQIAKSPTSKKSYKENLGKLIVTDSKINNYAIPIKRPEAFKILFSYLNLNNKVPEAPTQYGYISSFFDGFNPLILNESYDDILEHTTDSIDVFGLGFTLQFMANCFKRNEFISLEDYTRLSTFFHKMYDFNPETRTIDIDLLLNEYENILLEIGVLTRLNKKFKNNLLVNKTSSDSISSDSSDSTILSHELNEFAKKDVIENVNVFKNCEQYNKELNPNTNRCVKKCPPGYERNESSYRCRRTKRVKSHSIRNSSYKKTKTNKTNKKISKYNTI